MFDYYENINIKSFILFILMQAKSLEHKYYISEYATYMGGEK